MDGRPEARSANMRGSVDRVMKGLMPRETSVIRVEALAVRSRRPVSFSGVDMCHNKPNRWEEPLRQCSVGSFHGESQKRKPRPHTWDERGHPLDVIFETTLIRYDQHLDRVDAGMVSREGEKKEEVVVVGGEDPAKAKQRCSPTTCSG